MGYNDVNGILDIESFESVDFLYRFVVTQLNPKTIRVMKLPSIFKFAEALYFIRVHSIASSISFFYDNMDSKGNTELDQIFESLESFNDIECLVPLSTEDKIWQVRNCFAHGHYKIVKDSLDGIYIDNGKVRGKITDDDLMRLKSTFCNAACFGGHSKRKCFYTALLDNTPNYFKNRYLLNKELDKIEYYRVTASEGEDSVSKALGDVSNATNSDNYSILKSIKAKINKVASKGYKNVNFDVLKISVQEKELIMDIMSSISFSSLDNYQRALPEASAKGFRDLVIEVINRDNPFIFETDIYAVAKLVGLGKYFKNITEDDHSNSVRYLMTRPFIYSKMLLQYSFFTFDYLREMNERNENELFEYKNFDMTRLYYNSLIGEELVKEIKPSQRIQNSIIECNNKLNKLRNAKIAKVKRKQGLERAQDKVSNASTMITKLVSEIVDIDNDIRVLENQLLNLSVEKQNNLNGDYIDCRNLFRHLRNAIAHKRCYVDYKDAIKRNDYSRIQFRFEDYDKVYDSSGNVVGEKLVFTMECDARTLFRFLKDINLRIYNGLSVENELDTGTKRAI